MNSTDMIVLEQVGITGLLAQSHRWQEPVGVATGPCDDLAEELRALGRLEELGLVTRTERSARGGVSLTPAGIEALAYLAAAS